MQEAEKKAEVDRMNQTIAEQNATMISAAIDCQTEKDKILFALELALDTATKKSKHDEPTDLDETTVKEVKNKLKENKQ